MVAVQENPTYTKEWHSFLLEICGRFYKSNLKSGSFSGAVFLVTSPSYLFTKFDSHFPFLLSQFKLSVSFYKFYIISIV